MKTYNITIEGITPLLMNRPSQLDIGDKSKTAKRETQTEIKLEKEAKLKGIIKVKDYLWDGNVVYGLPYENTDKWILDDGDVYSIKDLLNEEYKVIPITPLQIEEEAKLSQHLADIKAFEDLINNKIKAIREQRKAEEGDNYYLEFAECLFKELKEGLKKI
jgi:hypothetical protein